MQYLEVKKKLNYHKLKFKRTNSSIFTPPRKWLYNFKK